MLRRKIKQVRTERLKKKAAIFDNVVRANLFVKMTFKQRPKS